MVKILIKGLQRLGEVLSNVLVRILGLHLVVAVAKRHARMVLFWLRAHAVTWTVNTGVQVCVLVLRLLLLFTDHQLYLLLPLLLGVLIDLGPASWGFQAAIVDFYTSIFGIEYI